MVILTIMCLFWIVVSKQENPGGHPPRDILKMPANVKERGEFARQILIDDIVEQRGCSPEEAAERLEDLAAVIKDPEIQAIHEAIHAEMGEQLAKFSAAEREAIWREAIRMAIRQKEAEANPKPTLKVWTASEDDRRAKPKGDDTPDIPG
jgi:hypothetical protein